MGTISDIQRGKKRFLAIFAGIGILATAMLVLVSTGDWVLASIFGILGRIGFCGANTFYDALLPHVAREDDRDRVSARGYAMGYLGGGILLAINIVMIQVFPGTWGARLSFVSVAIWWAVFSIPLFRHVPEPPAATEKLAPGVGVVSTSFKRLSETPSIDFGARLALKHFGLVPEKEVAIVQVGGMESMVTALPTNRIQAGILSYPAITQALKLGHRTLLDVATLGIPYAFTGMTARGRLIKEEPDLVRRYMMAQAEAIARAKRDKNLALKVMGKYLRTTNPNALAESYDIDVQKYMLRVPLTTAEV